MVRSLLIVSVLSVSLILGYSYNVFLTQKTQALGLVKTKSSKIHSTEIDQRHFKFLSSLTSDSPLHFTKVKNTKKTRKRIGVFAGSYAYGFPMYQDENLLTYLNKKIGKDFEIINFSSEGISFHNVYYLWEEFGRAYKLDYLIVGLMSMVPEKDLSFMNHRQMPHLLDGRYVLNEEKLQRIFFDSSRVEEKAEEYFRFFPPLKFLRYDTRSPGFILGLLGKGKFLRNIFYHDKSGMESKRIYETMLSEMRKDSKIIALDLVDHGLIQLDHLEKDLQHFPFFEYSHPSAFGNAKTAKSIQSLINLQVPEVISIQHAKAMSSLKCPVIFPASLSSVELESKGKRIGIVTGSSKEEIRSRRNAFKDSGPRKLTFFCRENNCLDAVIKKESHPEAAGVLNRFSCGDLEFAQVKNQAQELRTDYLLNYAILLEKQLKFKEGSSFVLTADPDPDLDLEAPSYPLDLVLRFSSGSVQRIRFGQLKIN